jgi:hypothetical protein
MARRRWIVWVAVVLGGCALLGGCGRAPTPIGGGGPFDEQRDIERQRQQAREALVRFDQAVAGAGSSPRFVPVGELQGQIGDWEPDNEQNKAALTAGMVVSGADLPAAPAGAAAVVWADGKRRSVPYASAADALTQLNRSGDCPDCRLLEITGARLTDGEIRTTRGPATVPLWEYTLKGTAVRITLVAVDRSAIFTVTPPSWDPNNAPSGLAIERAATSVGGRRLTVSFTGSPATGDKPCGYDYTGEAVESDNAVVVIVLAHTSVPPPGPGGGCPAIGAPRTTTVDLAEPLGERAVLEVQQGLPVLVVITE